MKIYKTALLFAAFLLGPLVTAQVLPDDLTLSIQVSGNTRTLNLSKFSQRSANFVYYTWSAPSADAENTGVYTDETVNAPQVRTYRGTVVEEPNTLIMASIRPGNKLHLSAFDHERGRGHIWTLSDLDISAQLVDAIPGNPYPVRPTGGHAEMELAIDINWHKRVNQLDDDPDLSMVVAEHEAAIYDHFMARDVDTAIVLSCVVSRTGSNELVPYTTNHLFDIAEEWTRPDRPLATSPWDQVHSYAPSVGLPPGVGGYAWQNRIGKTDTPGRGVGAIGVNAMYHESGGHNWDAVHLGYGKDNMGGNRPSQGIFNRPRVIQKRDARILTGDLSQPLGPYPSPVHPYGHADLVVTQVDTAVSIDPTANDADSNGDNLIVSGFSATSGKGGTVTQSGNTLTYTPPSGYVGKDLITYTVQDDSALELKTKDIIFVEVINSDLTVHYDFEETSGTSTANLTGLGHPGELFNSDFSAATEGAPVGRGLRVPSGGLIIDSSGALPPGTTLTASSDFYPFETSDMSRGNYFDPMDEDFAVAMWFRSDDLASSQDIFSKYWAAEQSTGIRMYADGSGVHVVIREIEGIHGKRNINSSVALTEGQWHHLALSIDRESDLVSLYLDGVDVGSVAMAADSHIFHGTKPFLIAANNTGQVTIDDFRLWTRAVSPGELAAIIDAAVLPPGDPSPVNGAYEIAANSPSLSWTTPEVATAFQVYLGSNRHAVSNATTLSPEYLGEVTSPSASAGVLDENSTYFWRVDQVVEGVVYPGAVWEFSTTVDELLLDANLYAWWALDETSGAIAGDSSGNARVGAVNGTIEWGEGIVGGAACFNGSDTDITLDLVDSSWPAYSVSFWARASSFGQPTWSALFNNNSAGADLQFDTDGRSPGSYRLGLDGQSYLTLTPVSSEWTHFAATYDGGSTRVFVNGELQATLAGGGNLFGQLQLGKDRHGTPRFHGCIDEMRVWERAVDRSEIFHLFSAPLPVQRREYFTLDGSSSGMDQLKNDPDYPAGPNLDFLQADLEIPTGGSSNNYGASLRALLVPEVSGDYTFYVSADDFAELLLSTDERADNATVIASVPNYTDPREWTKYGSQKSVTLTLEAGRSYFIEALMVEGGGGDHVAVAWEGPGVSLDVIPTSVLRRYHEVPIVEPTDFASYAFETGDEGWTNGGTFDWVRHSGPTPTPNTGPLTDQTTGDFTEGFYYYFDTSLGGAITNGDEAQLISPVIDPAVRSAVTFHYYMLGSDTGSLSLDVHHGGAWINDVWTITGQQQTNQIEDWAEVNVSLSAYAGPIQVRFRSVAKGGLFGNTAIDSISFNGFVAPAFDSAAIDLGTAPAAAPYQFDLNAVVTDPDEGDVLSYTKLSGPAWAEVTPSGFLTGEPPIDPLGLHTFEVEVEDSFGSKDQATVTLTTDNDGPVWAEDPQDIGTAQANLPYAIGLRQFVIDPNTNDTLTFTKTSGPAWFQIDSTGQVSGTPSSADVGPATIGVTVTDFHGLSDSAELTLEVSDTGVYYDTTTSAGLNFGNANWNTTETVWNADADGLADLAVWPGSDFVAIFNTGGSSIATLTENLGAAGVQFQSGAVTLTGSELALGVGGITIADSLTADLHDLNLATPQTWNLGNGSLVNVGNIESNGHPLTVTGSGDMVVSDGNHGDYDLLGGGDLIWDSTGTLIIRGRNQSSGDLIVNQGTVELRNFVWSQANIGGKAIVNAGGTLRPDVQTFGYGGRVVEVYGGTIDAFSGVYVGVSGGVSKFQGATLSSAAEFRSRGSYTILASDTPTVMNMDNGINLFQSLTIDVELGTADPALQADIRLHGGNSFTKAGAGKMVLNTQGDTNMAGAMNVDAGMMIINGALSNNSDLLVAAGATLGGSASYTSGATIAGTISPGNSIGTISIGGGLGFADGAVYRAEIADPANDRIKVSGDLVIGNEVILDLTGATVDPGSAPYVLLTWTEELAGRFSAIGVPEGWLVIHDPVSRQLTLEICSLENMERDWRGEYFTRVQLSDPGLEATVWGRDADPDGDGSSNLEELGFGSSPTSQGLAPHPARFTEDEAGDISVSFMRLRHGILNYDFQRSSDLAGWSEATATETDAVSIDERYDLVTMDIADPVPSDSGRYFRIRGRTLEE